MQNNTIDNIRKNKDKLKIGELYSYKQLAEILDIEYLKSTNSKKAQLKLVNTIVELDKIKTKYKIIQIREKETQVIKNNKNSRYNKKATYTDDILLTTLYFLLSNTHNSNKNNIVIYINKNELANNIGLKHEHNSLVAKYQPDNFCEQIDVNTATFHYTYPRLLTSINSALNLMLKKLKREGLATIFDRMKITTIKDGITRMATNEEYAKIEDIKREVLTEMNIKNEALLYNKYLNCIQEFYNKVEQKTFKELGIKNSYKILEIHLNRKNIDDYLRAFQNTNLEELLLIGNEKFTNKQITNCKNDKTRKLKKESIPAALILDSFDIDNQKIIDNLIDIEANNLKLETKED